MLLPEAEIQRCRALVERAFPRFSSWQFSNERNENYAGFCIWGHYQAQRRRIFSTNLFVTFSATNERWKGHLTVGKHCYYWSSASIGDADLLDTEPCPTLEKAISALKRQIGSVVEALSASGVEPEAPAD
jgi:hypothetical protein